MTHDYADEPRSATQPDVWPADDRGPDVHVTLPESVALRLQAVLPSLLRALADRETQTPGQRKRRHEAHVLLELVRDALNEALPAREARSENSAPR